MWHTSASTTSDDFDSPKSGGLPTFQKITSSPFYGNGRNPHMGYTSQQVLNNVLFTLFLTIMFFFVWNSSILSPLFGESTILSSLSWKVDFSSIVQSNSYSIYHFSLLIISVVFRQFSSMIIGRDQMKRIPYPMVITVHQQAPQMHHATVNMHPLQLHCQQVSFTKSHFIASCMATIKNKIRILANWKKKKIIVW